MMAKRLLIIALAFCLGAPALLAQNVDDIVNKHIAAMGGMDKIKGVKTLTIEGTMSRGRGDRVFETDFVRTIKLPDKVMTETFIRDMSIVQAYDGKQAWATMPFGGGGPEVLEDERAQVIKDQADFAGPLFDYKARGSKIELIGKETLDDNEVYNLKVTDKDGDVAHVYLDAKTYLETQRVLKRKAPGGEERDATTTFSDYREVAGLMMPHKMTTEGATGFMGRRGGGRRGGGQGGPPGGGRGGRGGRGFGGGSSDISITKVEVNASIDDKVFMMK